MRFFKIILFMLLFFSCDTINQPKPKGYLALNYPKSNYNEFLNKKLPLVLNLIAWQNFKKFQIQVIRFHILK